MIICSLNENINISYHSNGVVLFKNKIYFNVQTCNKFIHFEYKQIGALTLYIYDF